MQSALDGNDYEIKVFRDGGQSFQDEPFRDFDWIILDGRFLKGEREFARLFLQWLGQNGRVTTSRHGGCGMEITKGGAMRLSCAMHRMALHPADSPSYSPGTMPEDDGFLFEYHSPCGVKR